MLHSTAGRRAVAIIVALVAAVGGGALAFDRADRADAAGTLPRHIMTYILWGASEHSKGLSVDVNRAAQWVTWVIAKPDDSRMLSAAGIKTMYYSNPNRIAPKEPMYRDDDSIFAHDCSGNRIQVMKQGRDKQLTDPTSQSLAQDWREFAQSIMSRGHYDAIYDDTAASTGSLSALPCHWEVHSWIAAHVNLVQSLGVPVIYNGLGDGDLPHSGKGAGASYDLSPAIGISAASNTLGGSFEDCYTSASRLLQENGKTYGSYWQQTENTELIMASRGKIFMCEEMAPQGTQMSDAIDQRMYAMASVLLTVDPSLTMVHQLFRTPSHVDVGPEVGLVPSDPAVSTPSDIGGLRTSTGAYVREYRACYLNGSSVGPCAAAVNPNPDSSVRLSLSGYDHTLALSGGGVMDGGTANASGSAPPSSLGPLTGIIAIR